MENDTSLEQVVESEKRAKRLAIVGVALSMVALMMVMMAVVFMVSGLKRTVDELSVELNRDAADAVLASANVADATSVSVPVLYYSQKADECVDLYDFSRKAELDARVFEWKACGYYHTEVEQELVEGMLGEDYLPVAVGGEKMANRGINMESFRKWFSAVEGESVAYAQTLGLVYDAESASFKYENEAFYPLGEELFTMNLGVPVQVLGTGAEEFEITADDDTWVFVGNKIVIDMGGVHDEMTGRLKIMENGEVYSALDDEEYVYAGVNVAVNEGTIVRIFHANRNSESSAMKITFRNMVFNIADTTLARGDGVEVAYDPTNPGYVAPLGENMTVRPNRTRELALTLTMQLVMFGALAVVFVIIITRVLKKVQ